MRQSIRSRMGLLEINMKTAFAAAIALSLLSGTAAMAAQNGNNGNNSHGSQSQTYQGQNQKSHGQNGYDQNTNGQNSHSQNQNRQGNNGHHYGNDKPDNHVQKTRDRDYEYNGRRYKAVRAQHAWTAPKGYDARKAWVRGEKLPAAYRHRVYQVNPYAFHLQPAPRGYQWVRVQNNVFLVQSNNGLITQVIFNLFY